MTSIFDNTMTFDSSDKDIRSLVRDFTTGNIRMPDIQRQPRELDLETKNLDKKDKKEDDGWPLGFKEGFIHSIIEGVNIPPITLRETADGRCELYDGGHRLRCLTQFVNNCFGVQVDTTYYTYNSPLNEEESKLVMKRKLEDCVGCRPITSCSVISDADRRKFDKKTIKAITYQDCVEEDMIDIFIKLNNQASLSSGEKIYAGPHPVHRFLRGIRRDYLDNFHECLELRAVHRYSDMIATAGLFNLLFIPGGNPEPKTTIIALTKCTSDRWEGEFPEVKLEMFKTILSETFAVVAKCLELRNGLTMDNIGFNISKDKCKPYLFYTIALMLLKKYDSTASGFGDIDDVLSDMDIDTFAQHLLNFSQLSIDDPHMALFQTNTRTPSSALESEQDTITMDGVNNPNKTGCIKERATAIVNYIKEQ